MSVTAVIVVHFNQTKTTLKCLDSLARLKNISGNTLKVVIVDNGSKNLFSLPSRFNSKIFHLIRSDANLGFTGGNNLGIHFSVENFDPQYLWLLNNDATVDSQALAQLLKAADENPSWGMISPKIYFTAGKEFHQQSYAKVDRGKVIWFVGGVIDWRNLTAFHLGVDEIDRGQFDQISETDFCTGCAIFIKREVLEKIGFLDKRYFLYFEDVDWSLRAQKFGYKLGISHQAIVWHDNAGSSGGSGSNLQQYYQERNRSLLAWLHGNWQAKFVAVRLQLMNLITTDPYRRQAVIDFYRRKFGKQLIV